MKKNRHNKTLIIFLTGISLVIWGAVFDQLFNGNSSEATAKSSDDLLLPELPVRSIAVSDSSILNRLNGIRNPFQPYRPKKRKRIPRSTLRKMPEKLPAIIYRGILDDIKQPLAIVEMADGATQICAVGDSLGNFRISKISPSQIHLLRQGAESVLKLTK